MLIIFRYLKFTKYLLISLMKLVFATNNKHKLEEVKNLLGIHLISRR